MRKSYKLRPLQRCQDDLNDLTPYPTPFSAEVELGTPPPPQSFEINIKPESVPQAKVNINADGGNAVANSDQISSKKNNLFLMLSSKGDTMLEEFVVKNAGYAISNKAWGHEFDLRDQAMYAVAEWIYEYMGRDWIIMNVAPLLGLQKDSSYTSSFLIGLVLEILFIGAAYKLVEMATGEKKKLMDVMLASSGAYAVNELYNQVIKSKLKQ